MPDTSIHAFLTPRLEQLVAEAQTHGFAPDAVVAVMIELVDSLNFPADPSGTPQQDSPTT